jgi:hypothetical protein
MQLSDILHFICEMDIHVTTTMSMYRGADKSLDGPGRKQAAATEDFDVHISYLQS